MIEDLLGVEIILNPHLCNEEIKHLIEQEEAAQLALVAFCQGKISFEDYCDILELCECDLDDYIATVEENLLWLPEFTKT